MIEKDQPMPRTKRSGAEEPSAPTPRSGADDQLNDQFHALLRDAAEKREERALARSTEDMAAARRESADLLALSRTPGSRTGGAVGS